MTDTVGTVPSDLDDKRAELVEGNKNHELAERFLARVRQGRLGKNLGVPIPLENVNRWLHGVQQARYYLMGADSGVGKSSLGDFIFLLSFWANAIKEGKKVRIVYYSFEISGEEKIAAWVTYFISILHGVSLPVDYIMGYIHGNMVTDEDMSLIEEALGLVNEMLKSVTIHDSPKNPTAIYHDAIDLAEELGTVHREIKLSKRLKDKDGKAVKQVYITGFTPDDPDLTVLIILDHVALVTPEAGLSPKATIDRLSSYFVFIRNKLRFSELLIQQFNTEMQTVERRKFSQAAFAPQRSDFGDSKYTFRDADVVFGLIKPSFFDLQSYFGFQIEPTSGVTYGLGDSFVAAFLMKNRYGPTNKMMPLFMDGITKRFYDLPLDPSDPNEMEEFSAMNDKIKELCLLYSQPRK